MSAEKRTHYRQGLKMVEFEYYTMAADPDGVIVYGWGTYERHSVLAGQASKMFLEMFDTEAQAVEVYGNMNYSSKWTEPDISLNHLPDGGDGW